MKPLLLVGLGVFYDVPDKSGRLVGVADELHAQVLAVLPSHPAGNRAMGLDRQRQLCARIQRCPEAELRTTCRDVENLTIPGMPPRGQLPRAENRCPWLFLPLVQLFSAARLTGCCAAIIHWRWESSLFEVILDPVGGTRPAS